MKFFLVLSMLFVTCIGHLVAKSEEASARNQFHFKDRSGYKYCVKTSCGPCVSDQGTSASVSTPQGKIEYCYSVSCGPCTDGGTTYNNGTCQWSSSNEQDGCQSGGQYMLYAGIEGGNQRLLPTTLCTQSDNEGCPDPEYSELACGFNSKARK